VSFLGVLGSIGKAIVGTVAGAATGGLPGAIIGGIAGVAGGGVKSAGALTVATRPRTPLMPTPVRMPAFAPVVSSPAAAGAASSPAPGGVTLGIDYPVGACPAGFHLRKGRSVLHPFGGGCTKTRRMNVTNVRALRRSIRRLKGFEKLARRTLSITSPGPKRFRIKKTRRRS
jgi:hypothetical protein